jgi:hypothetical protein
MSLLRSHAVNFKKTFCFTGASKSYSRKELHKLIQAVGGWPSDNVTAALDYLVVCGMGNPNWAFSTYGRKICEAIKFNAISDPRRIRHKIILINEQRFFEEIKRQHPDLSLKKQIPAQEGPA